MKRLLIYIREIREDQKTALSQRSDRLKNLKLGADSK